jgi:hypothetical protein
VSVLLRQPGGFEGSVLVREPLYANDAAVPHGPYVPDVPACLRATLPPPAPDGERAEHLISGVDERMDLDMSIVELPQEDFHDAPYSFWPSLHVRKVGDEDPGGHELELRRRIRQRKRAFEVASVQGLDSSPHQFHVLLRHRPRSIPQAQTSA